MTSDPQVALQHVSFAYDTSLEPLFTDLTVHFPSGFTGIVGANGTGKTTLLHLLTGKLQPTSGTIHGNEDAIYCEQRTDEPPDSLAQFLEDWDSEAFELRGRLGIDPDFLERWQTLSHGERKRAQIAHALWQNPLLLAIDEPTNHIDSGARELLLRSLKRFNGVGLIVSHDRELLDMLCTQCVWLDPPNATVSPGGYTQARELREQTRSTAVGERRKVVAEQKALQREIVKRREVASHEHVARSKRGLSNKDSDGREKIDRARVSDSKAGNPLRQLAGRDAQVAARLAATRVAKEYETGIWLPGSTSRRNELFSIEPVGISLGDNRALRLPRLSMKPKDRIAITGSNGSGKSTLVTHILGHINLPKDKLIVMPQEISTDLAQDILTRARSLDNDQLGHVLNIVSRLGSRPHRLLESRNPSPGEVRKLLLALGMANAPHLIVMDEPTNHLDLPSIEALESALSECPCGLLLVSHDQRFLDGLDVSRWHIEVDARANSELLA
jgi:macrolide transport system ATP-binding/permease protein